MIPASKLPTKSKTRNVKRLAVWILAFYIAWVAFIVVSGFQMMDAARDGDTAFIRQLISRGANVNSQDPDTHVSLINEAATNGHTDTVQLLLEKGADINSTEDMGYTPLMSAVANGYPDTVKLLIMKGADLNRTNTEGRTALMIAYDNRRIDLAKILLAAGAK